MPEVVSGEVCATRLDEVKKDFLKCPEAKMLWLQVQSQGGFGIAAASTEIVPTGGGINLRERLIYLVLLGTEVPFLLMELSNMDQAIAFSYLTERKCAYSADEYAVRVTALEYEAGRKAYSIAKLCIDNGKWSTDWYGRLEKFSESGIWSNYEGFKEDEKHNGHADHYKVKWHKACG